MFRMFLTTTAVLMLCTVATAGDKGQLSKGEACFLKEAALNNLMEVRMGELAQKQAQDSQVKQFAEQMVRDHQTANDQLKELARSKGVDLPNELPKLHDEKLAALTELQGKEFDQAYMSEQKAAHLKAASKFQDKAQLAKVAEVKQFAAAQAPILQQHMQHAITVAGAQGLPALNINEAQTAGAKIEPDQGRDAGQPRDSAKQDEQGKSDTSDRSDSESR